MKKRTFITTLILFLIFFNSSILLISVVTLKDKINTQKERCLAEHYLFVSSLIKDIQALEDRQIDVEQSMEELLQPYMLYSPDNLMDLTVYEDNRQLTFGLQSDREPINMDRQSLSGEIRKISLEGKEHPYLLISGRFPEPYQQYALVYRYNMEETINSWRQMKNMLFLFGGMLAILLAICLLVILSRVFRPLFQISTASQSIAAGNYDNRLVVSGQDEIADMAKSFNHMADEIESKIAALREASEQKQRFIDNFAHELRTPLTAIYGYAEYMQKAVITEEDKLASTNYIMSECRRMQNMAYQLLNLAVLRGNEMKQADTILVSALFGSVSIAIFSKAADKEIQITYQREFDYLSGNQELLESLLINLIDNAIKASRPNGMINVLAYQENKNRIIQVADFGKGMTQEQLLHIREAFYRVDPARSRRDGGAGLGLSICDQIAEMHGAQIQFMSKQGEGTTVKIIFTT